MPVGDEKQDAGRYLCQEADQHLQSAKKNTHGNRDKGTRKSAGSNEGRRSLWKAVWMRWLNCVNMPQHRQRCSTLVSEETETWRSSPLSMATVLETGKEASFARESGREYA